MLVSVLIICALFILALTALLKCRREDVPEVIKALALWLKLWLRP